MWKDMEGYGDRIWDDMGTVYLIIPGFAFGDDMGTVYLIIPGFAFELSKLSP